MLTRAQHTAPFPPLGPLGGLAAHLAALGFCQAGPQPLSFAELAAYSALSAQAFTPWEAQALIAASRAFVLALSADVPPYAPLLTRQTLLTARLTEAPPHAHR